MCNCKCTFCDIWKTYRKNPTLIKKEMNLEQIKKIFLNSKTMRKVEKISLTGGEPFLRKDFAELFLFFYSHYPYSIFDITTNGQNPALIKKNLGKNTFHTIDHSKLNLLVSLDGLKGILMIS